MSLATRCPSCGTVFRVVQDQLRVSEGWVRCGRCNGVFNASEVLFDIDSGAPVGVDLGVAAVPPSPAAPPPSAPRGPAPAPAWTEPPAAQPAAPPAAPSYTSTAADTAWAGGRQEPRFEHEPAWPRAGEAEEPLLRTPSRHHDEADARADALADEIVITDHVPAPSAARPSTADEAPPPARPDEPVVHTDIAAAATPAASATASAVQAVPSFLRTAERDALWRRPAMRLAAGLGVLVLALTLALQAALLWRDSLAARWPTTAPTLVALCRLAGCNVQPLRRIESLAVHSSGLNRLDGSTLYRLQVVLQNRADTAVMMPALDLTLNDTQGKLVARRVLQAAELGALQAQLQAGEEMPIKALVSTGDRRVDGYTLELFYP